MSMACRDREAFIALLNSWASLGPVHFPDYDGATYRDVIRRFSLKAFGYVRSQNKINSPRQAVLEKHQPQRCFKALRRNEID